jgi:SAM-dependent methyltransferase
LGVEWSCEACAARYDSAGGIPNLRLPDEGPTEVVRRFYERTPFPGYPPRDSLLALRTRAARSPFARLLDQAIPGDARVVEIGCGTGQMCLYLSRADRVIVGADLARASLALGAAAAVRFGLGRVQFVETDLRQPGLHAAAFDVVYSSGVLHHTPDPRASFSHLARLARPGGTIIVGVYNAFARVPARLRRLAARVSGRPMALFDPVLRERVNEPERREAWVRDQYEHPLEHSHTLAEVQGWFADNGVEYLRSYPSAVLGDQTEELFTRADDDWRLEGWLAQLGWMGTLGREGGLFFTIGRRGPIPA